ncbi:MAG: hypothetical protein F4227_03290 [Gammaproteobacteria bacterium]|nr:hypothetical protein [Gammaproteobacteria bacterium]MYF02016.1 hypothetical protein [Gammaproteobacteria bacterium]MYI77550.1 hypothetical protein [Gammaproteobacteria bacterium]
MSKTDNLSTTNSLKTRPLKMLLDELTLRKLDQWRASKAPNLTRAEAAKILLTESLFDRELSTTQKTRSHVSYPSTEQLAALYSLERVSGFGPVKFRDMNEAGIDTRSVIENPSTLPFTGLVGEKLRKGISALTKADFVIDLKRAFEQLERAREFSASILTHGDPNYPKRVYASNNPIPVLYVRGDPKIWDGSGCVAVVGSRNTRQPYADGTRKFATTAAKKGIVVVSGFALGADSIGHTTAFRVGGKTVCVMPCGLDKIFPPENRELWDQLLSYPKAVFVSEFRFGQRASSLLLRKRNKLIVAFAQGILVSQSAEDGGAMNAYKFGREQRKPVSTFKSDGTKETTGNALIAGDNRTGAFAFESTQDGMSYEAWLQKLSS